MHALKIIRIGNPLLRQKIRPLTLPKLKGPELQTFLDDMVSTMHAANGVGLAANQVGKDVSAIVLECQTNTRYPKEVDFALQVYINAEILKYSRKKFYDWEGCLSVPGYRGLVPRAETLTIKAFDREGNSIRRTVSGFEARVLQHEIDHLNGLIYMDRMDDLKEWYHLDEFNKKFQTRIIDKEIK
uniref:Peptide deformylase n=1 Tax=uncultured bacterium W4-21b TaxID=1130993 RepID=H9BWN1_9BACT|nr:peptide deformylase [uncultured bacterium W4-21b]